MPKKDEATVEESTAAVEQPAEVEEKDVDEAMLDAVDEHLGELAPKEKSEDEPEGEEPETEGEKEPEGEEPEGEEPETEGEEEEKPEGEEEEKPDDKAEEAAEKDDGEKKPSDEFGELPENTKAETKERFNTMKGKYDEVHEQLKQTQAQLEDQVERSEAWANEIRATGTNPEQFGLMMHYIKKVNTGRKADLEEAFDILQEEYVTLARTLGKEGPNFDPLTEHNDLKQRVEDGELTREDALEIVQARSDRRLQEASKQATSQRETAETQTRDQVYNQLVQIGATIRKLDPNYKAKEPELIKITERVVKTEKDPSKWADMIAEEYSKLPNPEPAKPREKVVESIRPGTVTSASGKTAKEAKSAEDAVDMALAQL